MARPTGFALAHVPGGRRSADDVLADDRRGVHLRPGAAQVNRRRLGRHRSGGQRPAATTACVPRSPGVPVKRPIGHDFRQVTGFRWTSCAWTCASRWTTPRPTRCTGGRPPTRSSGAMRRWPSAKTASPADRVRGTADGGNANGVNADGGNTGGRNTGNALRGRSPARGVRGRGPARRGRRPDARPRRVTGRPRSDDHRGPRADLRGGHRPGAAAGTPAGAGQARRARGPVFTTSARPPAPPGPGGRARRAAGRPADRTARPGHAVPARPSPS